MKLLSKIGLLPRPEQLSLLAFLLSGFLLIFFFSPLMIKVDLSLSTVIFFTILPWMMLWPIYGYEVITSRTYRVEISLILIILILGLLNILSSEDIYWSFISMRIFLLSGILAFWASVFIFRNPGNENIFYSFSCLCLIVITIIEIITYLYGASLVFMYNPIPLGTLVILLALGPLNYLSTKALIRNIALISMILGLILVLLLQKRGTILAIGAMAVTWFFCHYRKSLYSVIAILVIIILIIMGWIKYRTPDNDIPLEYNILHPKYSILHRIELYSFAWEVFKKKPIGGIGIRPFTHGRYLADYQLKNKKLAIFPSVANELQTFDNMLVTGLVEFGTLMTLAYLSLIFYIIIRYCRKEKPFSPNRDAALIPLLPILGLAIHSMTYDSLIFPQINWLFHTQLGLLAVQAATVDEDEVAWNQLSS